MITTPEEMMKHLEVRKVADLFSHEQTISKNLKKLKESMLNIGHLVDPIVVDKETNVVLDGNHRLRVLEIIECPYATCQIVDYKKDDIKVGTWFLSCGEKIDDMVKEDSVKKEKVDFKQGMDAINSLKAPFMAVRKEGDDVEAQLIDPGEYKLKEMIEDQKYVLSSLKDVEVKYIADDNANEYLEKGNTVLFRRIYTKDDIVKAAQSNDAFPPKSTRHLIPNRIIRLNMKLGWLHESADVAQRYLEEMLKRRVYNGNVRRYSEPVVVIY